MFQGRNIDDAGAILTNPQYDLSLFRFDRAGMTAIGSVWLLTAILPDPERHPGLTPGEHVVVFPDDQEGWVAIVPGILARTQHNDWDQAFIAMQEQSS